MVFVFSCATTVLSLIILYVEGGLASLLQVKVTVFPSTTSPEGFTVKTTFCGGSVGEDVDYVSWILIINNY